MPTPDTVKPDTVKEPTLTLTAPTISEKVREKNAVATLRWLGYQVLTLGKPIPVTCQRCKAPQWANLSGNSPGVSDVLVSHVRWGGMWMMLETKRSGKAHRRKEQVELADAGYSAFYVTEEQAVRAVIETEHRMGITVNPKLLAYLRNNVRGCWGMTDAELLAQRDALVSGDAPNAAWRP